MNDWVYGRPTTMRATGLGIPVVVRTARISDGPRVRVTTQASDLLLHTSIGHHSVVVEYS